VPDTLTFEEFELLSAIAVGNATGDDDALLRRLENKGLVDSSGITEAGLEALEPYRVQRAVVLAAGFGSRMVPVTYDMPKPLVRVNGKRIIDSVLDALVDVGIEEIYIVRGYLAEQFDELLEDYPAVEFIENPGYSEANNISSIAVATGHFNNAYVCEADLVLRNPSLVTPYQYRSNYLGAPVEHTDDWCFITDNLRITDLLVGADNCHHMYGISYWTEEEGAHLGEDAQAMMMQPGGNQRYWDEVPLRGFADHYKVYVRECAIDDVAEIDTFEDLQAIDSSYLSYKRCL